MIYGKWLGFFLNNSHRINDVREGRPDPGPASWGGGGGGGGAGGAGGRSVSVEKCNTCKRTLNDCTSKADCRKKYMSLAKQHHPDRNPSNVAEATEKTKELNDCKEALVDKDDCWETR